MRRTYNDMALATGTNNLVTRSISGHLTEKMQDEYTSVWAPLQQRAISSIMDLMAGKAIVPQLGSVGGAGVVLSLKAPSGSDSPTPLTSCFC
jgi:hypothetical protein